MQNERKKQGAGYRKGNKVTVSKWKHSFYSYRAQWIEDGKPKDKGFKKKGDAEEWAEQKESELLAQGTESTVTHPERSAVIDYRNRIDALGVDLREVIRIGVDHLERAQKSCTVSELATRVIHDRERAGQSDLYIADLRQRLDRFTKDFGNHAVATVTREQIADWLHALKLAPRTTNNFRRILVVTFNDAIAAGFIEKNPAEAVKQSKVVEGEVDVLTPEELSRLIEKADARILPAILIGAFAGARQSEITELDWSDIDIKGCLIRIRSKSAKSSRNRLIPISKNLSAWLKPHARQSGKVWPTNARRIFDRSKRAAGFGEPGTETEKEKENKLKLFRPWPDNALRHSYASYHLAHHQNADELALNMGHRGTALIFSNYRAIVTPKAAKAYWSIAPDTVDNVISMKGAA
ncbi:MAG: site-specific integrase [Verrucomicrobiales bacterium]|nr:site-specific integrase [Verrucomicrobiales bacterium]